jgi:hypothetical protein
MLAAVAGPAVMVRTIGPIEPGRQGETAALVLKSIHVWLARRGLLSTDL